MRLLKFIYIKLVRINDTPQKIALGFGLGVFSGIMPGVGPLTALFLAFILRANRVSALSGSLLTNTWLSVLTFFLSIRTGSAIMKLDWQEACSSWASFLKEFHFINLFKLSVWGIILPVILGYFIISLCTGIAVYLITIVIISRFKKVRNSQRESQL